MACSDLTGWHVAIGAGGIPPAPAASYRRAMAVSGSRWHNRALSLSSHGSFWMPALLDSSPRYLTGVALACCAALALAQAAPPLAPVKSVTDTYFGTTV